MHRIEAPGATVDNKFTEGDPATSVPATEVAADWLNAVQEELAAVIIAAGLPLKTAATETSDQLLAAIAALRTAAFTGSNQSLMPNGYQKLPGGLILQWGKFVTNATADVSVTFPIAFPSKLLSLVATNYIGDNATRDSNVMLRANGSDQTTVFSASSYNTAGAKLAENIYWLAIGY